MGCEKHYRLAGGKLPADAGHIARASSNQFQRRLFEQVILCQPGKAEQKNMSEDDQVLYLVQMVSVTLL